jgi:hypothetical protein
VRELGREREMREMSSPEEKIVTSSVEEINSQLDIKRLRA